MWISGWGGADSMRLVPSLFKGCQAQSPVDTPPTTAVSVQGEACEKLQGVKGLLSVPKVVSLCFKKKWTPMWKDEWLWPRKFIIPGRWWGPVHFSWEMTLRQETMKNRKDALYSSVNCWKRPFLWEDLAIFFLFNKEWVENQKRFGKYLTVDASLSSQSCPTHWSHRGLNGHAPSSWALVHCAQQPFSTSLCLGGDFLPWNIGQVMLYMCVPRSIPRPSASVK